MGEAVRIRVDDDGLILDDLWVTPMAALSQRGGELRYDEQDEQAGDEPTSKVVWQWTGWKVRRFVLRATLLSRHDERDLHYRALALITEAYHGGMEPQRHQLEGPLALALAVDSPVIIESLEIDQPLVGNTIDVTIDLFEEDPETVSLTTAPPPSTPAGDDGTPDADLLGDDTETTVEEFENA